MRLLDKNPSTPLSLRGVASEAGITAPSIYAHFDSASMITATIKVCWEELSEELARAARRSMKGGSISQLEAQVRAYVRYANARPSHYQLLFAVMSTSPESSRYRQKAVEPVYQQFVKVLDRCIAEGYRLPLNDASATAMLLLSVVHGRVAIAHTAPDLKWSTDARLATELISAVRALITKP
jgi:AcrR family transcriptional regulator